MSNVSQIQSFLNHQEFQAIDVPDFTELSKIIPQVLDELSFLNHPLAKETFSVITALSQSNEILRKYSKELQFQFAILTEKKNNLKSRLLQIENDQQNQIDDVSQKLEDQLSLEKEKKSEVGEYSEFCQKMSSPIS